MAPKRIWEEDTLERRVVSLSERLLRLRGSVSDLSEAERDLLETALSRLERELDATQPDGPEGDLLADLRDELARRKIPASQAAREISISRQSLHAIITGRSHLGPKTKHRLTDWVAKSRACPDASESEEPAPPTSAVRMTG